MIAKLKQLLLAHKTAPTAEEQAHQLNLAAASMLLEVVYADEELSHEEANLLPQVLQTTLGLSDSDSATLIEQARTSRNDATSLFEFTNEINNHFSLEHKQQLILAMWQLAYADGDLCRYEDQIIRRCADLLHLKHSELIMLRNQANEG